MTTSTFAEQTLMRTLNYRPGRWVSVAPSTPFASGIIEDVHADPKSFSNLEIVLEDNLLVPVLEGMVIDIGTTPGANDIGTTRARTDAGLDTLPIALTSPGELPLEAGQYVTVRNIFRPEQVDFRLEEILDDDGLLIGIDEFMDYALAFGSPHYGGPPKANITGGRNEDGTPKLICPSAWEDTPECGYRTQEFWGDFSRALTRTKSIDSWLWVVPVTATVIAGDVDEISIKLQLPVGFHYVDLIVTDTDGFAHRMHFPIWVHSAEYMPFECSDIPNDVTTNWREQTIKFTGRFNTFTESVIYSGTTVCYWEVPDFGSEETPEGYRDHSLGWITEDVSLLAYQHSSYTLKLAGAGWWADRFDGQTQAYRDTKEIPTSFTELPDITRNRAMYYPLYYHSTIDSIVNIFFSDDVLQTTDDLDVINGSLWQQLTNTAQKFSYSLPGCDSFGNLWVEIEFSHRKPNQRPLIPALLDLYASDITKEGIALNTLYAPDVSSVSAAGSIYDEGVYMILASAAPGRTRSQGLNSVQLIGQYLGVETPQNDLDDLSGQHWKYLNAPQRNLTIILTRNMDVIEPAWRRPIRITWATETVHGRVLQQALFTVETVTIQHDFSFAQGTRFKIVNLTVRRVTVGKPGMFVEVPQDDGVTLKPDDETPCELVCDFTTAPVEGCNAVQLTDTSTGEIPILSLWEISQDDIVVGVSVELSPIFHAPAPGTYTVAHLVYAACGEYDVSTQEITIDAEEIEAGFTIGIFGKTVSITDTSSSPTGIDEVSYDYGDGSEPTPDLTHEYEEEGDYVVTQTVISGCGTVATHTEEITIHLWLKSFDFLTDDGTGSGFYDENPSGAAMTYIPGVGWESNNWSGTNHEYARLNFHRSGFARFVITRIEFDYIDNYSSGLTQTHVYCLDQADDSSIVPAPGYGPRTRSYNFNPYYGAFTAYQAGFGVEHFGMGHRIYIVGARLFGSGVEP